MNRKGQDVIRIITLLLLLETRVSNEQPFPDTESFTANENKDVTFTKNKTSLGNPQTDDGYYLDLLSGICREGWVKGRVNDVTVCLKTNSQPLSWSDARDTCRNDFSFLVKTEAPVSVQTMNLQDYLLRQNIEEIWTGLHEEGGYLVWDEISPHKVRAYNDPLEEELLQRRSWNWNIVPDDDDDDADDIDDNGDFEFEEESHSTCGLLNFNRHTAKHLISKRSVIGILNRAKSLQTEDALELDQTAAPSSREVESPPEPRRQQTLESLQLQRWMTEQIRQLQAGRKTVHEAKEVKEYINSQRDRLLEGIEHDQEFTTNLNKAIEPVKPTEETDFSDKNKANEKFLKLLSGLSNDDDDSNNTFQKRVTPRSIPTTAASLVSVPTRPTKPVLIPMPTNPVKGNLTATEQNTNKTEPKLGLPIPTVRLGDEKTKEGSKRNFKPERNMYPDDVVDYEDLLLSEKKKTTQSNVLKPTRKSANEKAGIVPTRPSIRNKPENLPPLPSISRKRKPKPVRQTKTKTESKSKTQQRNGTVDSDSSSEEQTDVNPIGIANSKATKLEIDKIEKMKQILDSLVSSSESADSIEDTNEIDEVGVSKIPEQQGKETGKHLLKKDLKLNFIPPPIGIVKEGNMKSSKSSSTLSDEKKHRVSETDEIIITDEVKSESVERLKGKLSKKKSMQDKSSVEHAVKAKTPKPVAVSIGQADSDDVKAYMEAMKLTTKKDSSERIKEATSASRKEQPAKSTTLFNAKTFYDLTETDEDGKTDKSKEKMKPKVKESLDKSKMDSRGGLLLPSTLLELDHKTESDSTSKQDEKQAPVDNDSEEKSTSKVNTKTKAVAIPVMTAGGTDESYIKEYIKAIKAPIPRSSAQINAKKTKKMKSNPDKNNQSEKKEMTAKSSEKSTSSDSKVEKEESSSYSHSSGSISFEDEERNRDKKQLFDQNTEKDRKAIPPAIKVIKPKRDQTKQREKESSDTVSDNKSAVVSNEVGSKMKETSDKVSTDSDAIKSENIKTQTKKPKTKKQRESHVKNSSDVSVESESVQTSKEMFSSSDQSTDNKGSETNASSMDKAKGTERRLAESKIATGREIINQKDISKEEDQSTEDTSSEIKTSAGAKLETDASLIKVDDVINTNSSNERDELFLATTTSTLRADSVTSKSGGKTSQVQRKKIGGLIIPTQSTESFGRLSDKSRSDENEEESTISTSVKITNNTDIGNQKIQLVTIPSSTDSIPVTSNMKKSDFESSKESSSEKILSSEEVSASTESSVLTSSRRDYGDDQDSSTVNRESEPDDAKLVIDRTDKNKTDSYSSDEESSSTESISSRTVTIIPGVEDYMSTSASDEDSSEEIKATLPYPTLELNRTQFVGSEKEEILTSIISNTDVSDKEKSKEIKTNQDDSDELIKLSDNSSKENGRVLPKKDSDVKKEGKPKVPNAKITEKLSGTNPEDSSDVESSLSKPAIDSSEEVNKINKNSREKHTEISNHVNAKTSEDVKEENNDENKIFTEEESIVKSTPKSLHSSDIDNDGQTSKQESGETKSEENSSRDESLEVGTSTVKNERPTVPTTQKSEEKQIDSVLESQENSNESVGKDTSTVKSARPTVPQTQKSEEKQTDSVLESQENSSESVGKDTSTPVLTSTITQTKESQESSKSSNKMHENMISDESKEITTSTISHNVKFSPVNYENNKPNEEEKNSENDSTENLLTTTVIPSQNIITENDERKNSHVDADSVDRSEEDLIKSSSSLPLIKVLDTNSGEIVDVYENEQLAKRNSSLNPIHTSDESDADEDKDEPISIEKDSSINNSGSNTSMHNSDRDNMKSNSAENASSLKPVLDNSSREDNTKDVMSESSEKYSRNATKTSDEISTEQKHALKISMNNSSSSSDSTEDYFGSSEEDNDKILRFRNSDENKLMKSGNYELKDFYDHNNEIVDVPNDESMYRKEINRDKMERDKHFVKESSGEIPIVLEAIKNIDDVKPTNVQSDDAFRSLFEKLNNKSRVLMAEAASKDEIRHREDQDLESAGIRAGEVSDDVDMDPEDILAQEADLKAEANVNSALLPNFLKSQTVAKTTKNDGKASMKLSHCHQRRTSMCYTYPVTVESTASTCDSGWVGHVFHKKCYRIMRNANTIPKMPYKNAMSICKMEGGSLAELTDGFGGNFLLMTLLKSIQDRSRELPPKEEIPPVWVRRGAQDPSCNVMTISGPIAMSCDKSIAVAVCEKNANDLGGQNTRNRNMSLDVQEFTINDKKILECNLQNSAIELPILWFKDGRLIDIKVKKRIGSILPHLGGRPIAPLPEPAETPETSLELNTWLRKTLETSTDQSLSNEIFQGHYWCERWRVNPFVREKSRETFVRFTDVITFVGRIRLPAIPYDERLLHNKIEKNLPPILSIMADLRFINQIVFRKLQEEFPNLEQITAYPGEISSTPPLELTFNVYIRASKNYTTADEMPLYKSMRHRYQEILRDGNILTRLPQGTPLRFIRSLKIRSTVSCHQMTLRDPRTKLVANFFPAGINLNVSSIEICENGERAGRATCKGNFRSGAYWANIQVKRRCGTQDNLVEEADEESDELIDTVEEQEEEQYENLVERMTPEERLKELAEMEIEENNLESVIEETAEIADTVEDLQEIDLEYINEIMEKSAISDGKSRFVAAKALETVDRLLTMDDTVFQKAKRVSSIIKNFEKIVEETELSDDGHFRLVLPNVAMEIFELEKHSQPIIGMAARTDENGRALYTPFNQQRIVSIYNDSAFYDDIDVAIHLPPELVQETKQENKSRLYMMVYRDGNMFQDPSVPVNVDQASSDSSTLNQKRLNSFVISASIGGRKIEGLKQKVKTIFRPIKDAGGSPITCAFYNFTMNDNAGGWSSAGCVYDGQVNGRDVCLCDHLTNFAVLVDYYGQDERVDHIHEVSLSIISLIGLSLSILGLSLTIISFVFFRKLRKGRAQQTLFNLALAMLCSWVIFLVGIKQTYHFIGCLIVAILLHYFILASFMWMLMEAFLQYLTFVKVLGTYVTRYTLKSVIAAWGLPVIPIICVLSIDHNLYKGGDHYCWMSVEAFYYAFAIPVGVIILANLVIFIITVVSIFRRPQGLRSNQSKHKMAITNLQAAITSFVLLGLSWILGYFAISDARLPFQYAFTILNSLQGFFIFVLFVARKKQVREQWKMICCCIYPEQQKAQRTLSASASYPSTCSSRSTSSTSTLHHKGRTDRSDSCKTTTSFIGTEYDSIYTVPYSRASRDSLYYRKL